jgi:hypothetical protein
MGIRVNNAQQVPESFETGRSVWSMFHLSFIGSIKEVAEFEDEFFGGGGVECNTRKTCKPNSLDRFWS